MIQGLASNLSLYLLAFFERGMSIKNRIDFALVCFKGQINIFLFSFLTGFTINREVIKNKVFLIKVWPVSLKGTEEDDQI